MTHRRFFMGAGAGVGIAAGLLLWLLLAASGTPARATTSTPPLPFGVSSAPFTANQVPQLAQAYAAAMGDPSPTLIQHAAAATRSAANAVMTGGTDVINFPDMQDPSYLIVIHGRFHINENPDERGQGVRPQTPVSTLMLVVNATTGQVTDSGLANAAPNLAALGSVKTDFAAR